MLLLRFQQGVPDAGQLTFIAEESEDGRNQQHRLPQDELRSFPMIKQRHRRQCADKKETDLANTEQDMTQYNAMTKPDFGLKMASVPISRLHQYEPKHRDGKVPRRTHHDRSGSQLLVVRERIPEKHLGSYNLCDDRPPEKTFACRTVHLNGFQQLRTMEPRHRKLKLCRFSEVDGVYESLKPSE